MAATDQALTVWEGCDNTVSITHVGSDASTATAITFAVGASASASPLFSRTLAGGHISGVTATGFNVAIVPANTAGIGSATPYYWEVRMVDAGGNTLVTATGTITINPSNTG
jgi:hypothetical protein